MTDTTFSIERDEVRYLNRTSRDWARSVAPLGGRMARHVRRRGYVQPTGMDRRFNEEDEWGSRRPEWHWWAYVRHMRALRNGAALLACKRGGW